MGKHLYENCICGILKSKTVVLVTHHLNLISTDESVQVVVLKEGRVTAIGPFDNIKDHLDWEVKSSFDVDQHEKKIEKSKKDSPTAATTAVNK